MTTLTGSGIFIGSEPSQEKECLYKVSKTANINSTLNTLNTSRANKDWKIIKFYPCSDTKKLEEFVKSALKKKYIPNSTEWVKLEDETALTKVINTLETLADIVNNADS